MKKITLLLAMLVVSFGYSQTLPIDFEESDDSNIIASVSDGGTFNIIDDADNAGESVGEFSGKVGGALYDHINVPLTTSLDIAATNTISFRVKQTTTEGTTSHLFKLQPNGGTGSNQEVAFTTEYDVWKDVSLTYSGTGTYNELIIFFDFNSASVSGTYLIDDIVASSGQTPSPNSVTVATSQEWNAYVNAFNVSDDTYAFGFAYTVSDLRATPTTTSMTLEPNTAIWTANATDAGWFDQGAATQTANKYIEALSYIEDATLANEELTFSGNISVSDLGDGYTVVAFIKTLTSAYSTVAYKTADISSTGDFTITATADEMSQAVIQYGFSVTGPLADPTDTSLGSVVVGTEAPPASGNDVTVATSQEWNAYVNAFNVSDDTYAFGFAYTVSDLRATPTTTSMTLEPNTAIWTANATDAGWFDQGAATQTANKYIEALSYIEDATLANEELTFSGNISVSDLGDGYTVVAFIKTLTSAYSTVAYKTADISSTGDFTITATADEMSQAVIQYGFSVTGPLADPTDTSLGSVVVGAETLRTEDINIINVSVYPNPSSSNWNFRTPNTVINSVEVFNLLGKRVASQRSNNSAEASISTQGLTSGIYIARITTEQGAKSVKLIKN
ncbi:T9SS type A sorting domain-containing protein [Flavobacteriaceae bacterium]|nr:T9SS type A sorting domain-containing protein [Flavobacteriaceae bacterium]